MHNRTKYQGGSLLGFVATGVLLAVLLVGGIYFIQRYSDDMKDAGKDIASTTKDVVDDKKDTKTDDAETDKTPVKEEEPDTTTDTTTAPDDTDATGDTATPTDASDDAEVAPSDELPQTGPADAAIQVAAATLLTFLFVSYVRSRSSGTL